MRRRCTGTKRSAAFTLVEMLVVVAVMLLLMALLLPALNAALTNAYRVQCLNNERQLGSAMLLYAVDNTGVLPRSAGGATDSAWVMNGAGNASVVDGLLWPYLTKSTQDRRGLLQCPADDFQNWSYGCNMTYATRNFSYSMNYQLSNNWPVRLLNIKNSSRKILIYDERRPNDCYFVWGGDCDDLGADRHYGMGHYFFVDGHAAGLTPDTVWTGTVASTYCDFFY